MKGVMVYAWCAAVTLALASPLLSSPPSHDEEDSDTSDLWPEPSTPRPALFELTPEYDDPERMPIAGNEIAPLKAQLATIKADVEKLKTSHSHQTVDNKTHRQLVLEKTAQLSASLDQLAKNLQRIAKKQADLEKRLAQLEHVLR